MVSCHQPRIYIATSIQTLTFLLQLLGLYMIIALAFWASPSGALDNYLAPAH